MSILGRLDAERQEANALFYMGEAECREKYEESYGN